MIQNYFIKNARLGISIVQITDQEWVQLTAQQQQELLYQWELIRATIPGRIHEIEQIIIEKQDALSIENHFETACVINRQIYELASIINDLHLWYRANQEISNEKIHG